MSSDKKTDSNDLLIDEKKRQARIARENKIKALKRVISDKKKDLSAYNTAKTQIYNKIENLQVIRQYLQRSYNQISSGIVISGEDCFCNLTKHAEAVNQVAQQLKNILTKLEIEIKDLEQRIVGLENQLNSL